MLMKYRVVPHALKKMNTIGIRSSLKSTALMDCTTRDFEYELGDCDDIDNDHFDDNEEGLDFTVDLADSCLNFCKSKYQGSIWL